MSDCPFCRQDPYEYVDVGVGVPMPVAINCCWLGIALYNGNKKVMQILEFRRSPSPRKKARAAKLMEEIGGDHE